MALTKISIRTSKELKAETESFFKGFGLTTTDGVRMLFAMTVKEGKYPFEVQLKKEEAGTGSILTNIRVEITILKKAQEIFSYGGMTLNYAVVLFFSECVKRGEVPFRLREIR